MCRESCKHANLLQDNSGARNYLYRKESASAKVAIKSLPAPSSAHLVILHVTGVRLWAVTQWPYNDETMAQTFGLCSS